MKIFLILAFTLLSVATAVFPEASVTAARSALSVCSNIIIPSLFPYLVCANLLTALGVSRYLEKIFGKTMPPLFRINGSGALALILGLISGYPCGAATVCALYQSGSLSENEAVRLLAFANNSGPLFIISAVGTGVFHSPEAGMILYISHVAGALLTGFALRFFATGRKRTQSVYTTGTGKIFSAVSDSVSGILSLCGYVVFFAVAGAMLDKTGITYIVSKLLSFAGLCGADAALVSSGVIEITSGLINSGSTNLPLISMILSLGGVSVLMQTYSFVRKSNLSLKPYIFGKLFSGVCSFIVTKIALYIHPVEISVFAPVSRNGAAVYINYLAAVIGAATFFFALYFLAPKHKNRLH